MVTVCGAGRSPLIHCGAVGWWGRVLWYLLQYPVLGSGQELCSTVGQSPGHHHVPNSSGGWPSTHTAVIVTAVREPEGCSICTPQS